MPRSHTISVLTAGLALAAGFAAAPARAASPELPAGTTVVLSDVAVEPVRSGAPSDPSAPGSLSAPAVEPSAGPWILPFVVQPSDPVGTTTLLAVRNDAQLIAADVLVEFFSPGFNLFHTVSLTLGPRQVQSFNLRDQPNLPPGPGTTVHGLVRVTATPGGLVSVDTFRVDPGEDFATGGLAPDFSIDECAEWKGRILLGGGFTGGTALNFIIDGPQGADTSVDPPTITGNVYDEAGNLVNGFSIWTDSFVLEMDADILVTPAELAGSFELLIDGTEGGGHVTVEHRAEGRYSVSVPGVCLVP